MGILKLLAAVISAVIIGSVILMFIKKYRKIGISLLGVLLGILIIAAVYVYHPRHYDRDYLEKYTGWNQLTLRGYADSLHFYIGAIPGGISVTDPLFYENLNSVTPENDLKMGTLLKDLKNGAYDFSQADMLVDQALEKHLRIRGHTLVWGKLSDRFRSPDLMAYLENYPEQERGKILQAVIDNHITTVLNHYKGRITTWDVVNEPMSMFSDGELEDNVYLKYLGEEYIARSFELAHSVDPDMKLFLNENFISYAGKTAESFLELIRKLKDDDVPVDGVGIQAHSTPTDDISLAELESFMKRITDLGMEVEITELDARLRSFKKAEDPYEAQGEFYGRLLKACLNNPMCKGLTFWGFSDSHSWQDQLPLFFPKPNEPYLFDEEMHPKPAYYEIYKMLKAEYEARTSDHDQYNVNR